MSQKRTLSSLRSGPGAPAGSAPLGFGCPSTIDPRGSCSASRSISAGAAARNSAMAASMTLRWPSETPSAVQVGVIQVRQGAKVDVVFGKDFGIFA